MKTVDGVSIRAARVSGDSPIACFLVGSAGGVSIRAARVSGDATGGTAWGFPSCFNPRRSGERRSALLVVGVNVMEFQSAPLG